MAIVKIGERRGEDEGDVVDAFQACHQRIRSFLELCARVGQGGEADQIVDACRRIERYFRQAMPLHVADEEDSVLPRLRGRDSEVDRALTAMHEQHGAHEAALAELTGAAAALAAEPGDSALRVRMTAAADLLSAALIPHLELEEAHIFPAMRRLLGEQELAAIAVELRSRRA